MNPAQTEARATLEAALPQRWEDIDPTIALLLEGCIEPEDEILTSPALRAAAYLQSLPNGLAWLDLNERYPERKQRQERIQKYCCFEMFEAVTEPDYPLQVSFQLDRDFQTYWLIGGEIPIRFCPWCGQPLPTKPFEQQ